MSSVRLVACLVGLFSVSVLSAADWPQWRGPDRNGIAIEKITKLDWKDSPPKHLWTIDGMGKGFASVAIVDGRLYSTGNLKSGQGVVCVDVQSQRVLWSRPLTEENPDHSYPGSRCTPTVDGDHLYVVTSDGQISCLRTGDGEVVWKRNLKKDWGGKMMSGWGYSESPLVDGDWVLCTPGAQDAMIVALDKKSGEEIWASQVPDLGENGKNGAGYSSIVVSEATGVKQYVQLVGRGVIGVRASDGEFLWSYNKVANGTANIPTPICFGDYVFASTGYGTGACLLKLSKSGEGVTAQEEYFLDSKTFQNHHGGMIRNGEYLFAGHQHNKGWPICLHIPTGQVKWGGDIRPEGSGSAAITQINDQIIFRYQDGLLALIEATPDGYNLQGTFRPEYQEAQSWSHPVVVDGKLYLREQDKLMCYELSN
ncbi:MAG: PQQ-like beta-propeller repeat protein [Planctomycetaceae bacterium]|nr:PQQ-like beta-propeller repeat protein [Planctomycetaceae bacterium]